MTFEEAIEGCKAGEFVKAGFAVPKTVVHVGANDGHIIPYYLAMGVRVVIAFEPGPAYKQLYEQFKDSEDVIVNSDALGAYERRVTFFNPEQEYRQQRRWCDTEDNEADPVDSSPVPTLRTKPFWVTGYSLSASICYVPSALIVAVPGSELSVLAGFRDLLRRFAYAIVRVSREPAWEGAPYGQSIKDYMAVWGFEQLKPKDWDEHHGGDIPEHGDMLFLRYV
jgi:FkbM family methyltransferase